jgi:hypothetical protein
MDYKQIQKKFGINNAYIFISIKCSHSCYRKKTSWEIVMMIQTLWRIFRTKLFSDINAKLDEILRMVNKSQNELSLLCDLYGSDKGSLCGRTAHTYTSFYEYLFSNIRSDVKLVLECGLGTNNPNIPSNMGKNGQPGASLRVWRDYFPNAQIIGVDIDKDILFTENRIETRYIDQTSSETIMEFFQIP